MDPWGLLKELREGWPAVRTAKWVVFVALVTGAVAGFGIATLWWTGTVSTLRERLSFSQDKLQIALASPSNPAALLTKEAGRHLEEKDRKCLVQQFKDRNKEMPSIIVSAFTDDESRKYAAEFATLFLRMGYNSGVMDGRPTQIDDVGVMVGLTNPEKPTPAATKFMELMSKCGLLTGAPIKFNPPPILLPEIAALEFDLFVGPKERP
jgi:hypothetical protein